MRVCCVQRQSTFVDIKLGDTTVRWRRSTMAPLWSVYRRLRPHPVVVARRLWRQLLRGRLWAHLCITWRSFRPLLVWRHWKQSLQPWLEWNVLWYRYNAEFAVFNSSFIILCLIKHFSYCSKAHPVESYMTDCALTVCYTKWQFSGSFQSHVTLSHLIVSFRIVFLSVCLSIVCSYLGKKRSKINKRKSCPYRW